MSGYVASARIVRAAPRLVRGGGVRDGLVEPLPTARIETVVVESDRSTPAAASSDLLERVRSFHDRWSQLTFFLFDPNSWR